MRKFIGLVKNEYIKIFAKVSTIIFLVILVVCSVGLSFILWGADKFQDEADHRYEYMQSYDELINEAQNQKYTGWEQDVEIWRFCKENDIEQYSGWRYESAWGAFYIGSTEPDLAEKLKTAIVKSDWESVFKLQKKYIESGGNASDITYMSDNESALWAINYRLNNNVAPDSENWKSNLVDSAVSYMSEYNSYMKLSKAGQDENKMSVLKDQITLAKYRLDNDIRYHTSPNTGDLVSMTTVSGYQEPSLEFNSFWSFFQNSSSLISVLGVLVIVIASGILAAEFSHGTVKFLLISPVKRWKIIVAKYFTVLSFAFILLVFTYLLNIIVAGIFSGFAGVNAPCLTVKNDVVYHGNSFLMMAVKYLVTSISVGVMATFAFAISSITRNSGLAIGLGVFLEMAGGTVITILSALNVSAGRYLIFANTDLSSISKGAVYFIGQTVPFAIGVIAVYMVVFWLTAWDGFVRRDVR